MSTQEMEALLLANLPLLERLGRAACRGSAMDAGEVEDFLSDLKLKLIDRDYAALRSFQGRCSMATWCAMVVQRHLLDYRAHAWGRFRPSAEAQRLGETAVKLESLLVRDQKTPLEAVEMLARSGIAITLAEAEALAARFPRRSGRPIAVPLSAVDTDPATSSDELQADREATSRAVSVTMRESINDLPAEDQTLLQLHFAANMSVADISRSLGVGQQVLYRRLRRLCALFRERLVAAGVDAERVRDLLDDPSAALDLGLTSPGARPSTREAGRAHD